MTPSNPGNKGPYRDSSLAREKSVCSAVYRDSSPARVQVLTRAWTPNKCVQPAVVTEQNQHTNGSSMRPGLGRSLMLAKGQASPPQPQPWAPTPKVPQSSMSSLRVPQSPMSSTRVTHSPMSTARVIRPASSTLFQTSAGARSQESLVTKAPATLSRNNSGYKSCTISTERTITVTDKIKITFD